jgi:dephospho-CoA kinase
MALHPVQQRRIGLTGGIATGKSTVSRYLERYHQLPILDADQDARAVVEPGSPVLARIVERYGSTILQPDGTLHRAQLGTIVFADVVERQWLDQQIHPLVRDRIQHSLHALPSEQCPIVVLAIPLLFEANMTDLATEIWVVTCSPEQQLHRLMQRNALSLEQAQTRLTSQLPLATKIAFADVVLDNSYSLEVLYKQVEQALQPANLQSPDDG